MEELQSLVQSRTNQLRIELSRMADGARSVCSFRRSRGLSDHSSSVSDFLKASSHALRGLLQGLSEALNGALGILDSFEPFSLPGSQPRSDASWLFSSSAFGSPRC